MTLWETKLDPDTTYELQQIAANLRVSAYRLTRIALLHYLRYYQQQTRQPYRHSLD